MFVPFERESTISSYNSPFLPPLTSPRHKLLRSEIDWDIRFFLGSKPGRKHMWLASWHGSLVPKQKYYFHGIAKFRNTAWQLGLVHSLH